MLDDLLFRHSSLRRNDRIRLRLAAAGTGGEIPGGQHTQYAHPANEDQYNASGVGGLHCCVGRICRCRKSPIWPAPVSRWQTAPSSALLSELELRCDQDAVALPDDAVDLAISVIRLAHSGPPRRAATREGK